MASTTESEITAKQTLKNHSACIRRGVTLEKNVKWPRTENKPCLTELQVDPEVCLEADVRDGDIWAWFPTQAPVLPEAMPDTCETDAEKEQNQTVCLLWLKCSEDCEEGVRCALTVADSSDDPKDEEPEEHISGVA